MVQQIVLLAFPGVNLLDVAGPAQVFTSATELYSTANEQPAPAYAVTVASVRGGLTRTTSGLEINTVPISTLYCAPIDTLLIAGGHGSEAAGTAEEVVGWLYAVRPRVRRIGSICTGAFVLAAAGLAEGRRLATHWAYATGFRNFIQVSTSNGTPSSLRMEVSGARRGSVPASISHLRWSNRISDGNSL